MEYRNDFDTFDFPVKELYAIHVPAKRENPLHENRASHGLIYNLNYEKTYVYSDGTEITVQPNELFYLPYRSTYTVHSQKSPPSSGETPILACIAINFTLHQDVTFPPFKLRMKNFHAIQELFDTLSGICLRKPDGYQMKGKSLFYELLYQVQNAKQAGYVSSLTRNRLAPAVEYLSSHYPEGPLSVPDLAAMSGMSEVYFRRLFTQVYGTSPVKYINSLRISRAKELIASGFYSLSEIAGSCGFNDPSYFISEFKRNTGMTPSAYRDSILPPVPFPKEE